MSQLLIVWWIDLIDIVVIVIDYCYWLLHLIVGYWPNTVIDD